MLKKFLGISLVIVAFLLFAFNTPAQAGPEKQIDDIEKILKKIETGKII